jgi:hypothetical protein
MPSSCGGHAILERHLAATIAACAAFALADAAQAAPCAPASAARPVETVRTMYAAAMAGDKVGMTAAFAPEFHAFDQGKRYSANQFGGLIDYLKANHLTMTWTINSPQETVSCDVAWVDWDNLGTITDASGTKPLEWLESAVLRWHNGGWKLVFFHSTPVPDQKR